MALKESAEWLLQRWLDSSDNTTGAPQTIDTVHHEVHEGEMFHASHTNGSVANGASVDLLLSTGYKECHTVFEVSPVDRWQSISTKRQPRAPTGPPSPRTT